MNILLTYVLPFFVAIGVAIAIYARVLSIRKQKKEDYIENFISTNKVLKSDRKNIYSLALNSKQKSKLNMTQDGLLYTMSRWIPNFPINLDNLELYRENDISPKLGKHRVKFEKFDTYSNITEAKDKPTTFFPGKQYRLLDINNNKLIYSKEKYTYFDKINYGGSLAYEVALNYIKGTKYRKSDNRSKLLKNFTRPSDYVVLSGISTLTLLINEDGSIRFIMHLRGQKKTAYARGTYHVIPAGEFQPASVAPISWKDDFSIFKNIMREYSEEIEDMEEHDGSTGVPFDYNQNPFISLEKAKRDGKLKIFYLGTGLDCLSLQAEIMTCAVFDERCFHDIFPQIITENKEGKIITDKDRWGRPFTDDEIDTYFQANTLASGETILKIVKRNIIFFRDCLIEN